MSLGKKKYGQYFTPKIVANFMVSLLSVSKDSSILEPSAGQGVFIEALEESGFFCWTAYEIDPTIIQTQGVKNCSFVSTTIKDQFDAVIGNPPYIRWKHLEPDLKEELRQSVLWAKYFNALCDYLFIFIVKSVELLKEGGELVFICSDYWLSSTNAQSLREYLLCNGYFECIYLFKETPIFKGVSASLMIIKYVKHFQIRPNTIKLYRYQGVKVDNLEELFDANSYHYELIPSFKPRERWLLANKEVQGEAKALEKACSRSPHLFLKYSEFDKIGDYFNIGNGMVSGLDKAFNLTGQEYSLSTQEEIKTIKVIKARDIQAYSYQSISKYIYIEDKSISEQEMQEHYQNIYSHLSKWRDSLSLRFQYGRNIDFWSFTFPRNKALFDRDTPRILVPCKDRVNKRKSFRFCLAPSGIYPLQDVTGLIPKNNCRESMEYVLAYLNSPQVYSWLMIHGIVKGDIVEFSEAPLSSIPYKSINWDNQKEVELHNEITRLVQELDSQDVSDNKNKINNLLLELLQCL